MTFLPDNSKSVFLPPYEVFPTEDDNHLQIKLSSSYTDVANCVNVREISIYEEEQEILTGQQFSVPADNQTKNYVFRKVFYFGAIAPGATFTAAHGITGLVRLTNIYGTCITDVVDYRPIPYSSTAAVNQQISIRVFPSLPVINANIEIINGAASPAITSCIVVLEYLKS